MGKVERIEHDVEGLSEQELREFRRRFRQFDADSWDRQLEEDVNKGKLDAVAEESIKAFRSGKASKL